MIGQVGNHVQRRAVRVVDDQLPCVQVHLAADGAGQERLLPAVFAVANDRKADRRHMHAQLVGAPGHGLQFHPRGAVAGAIKHAVAGAGGLALAAFIDHHLLAAGAGLLGQRQFDQAFFDRWHADHQRPVDLARRAPGKPPREICRAARRRRDQQNARGVLVKPVDQPRAGAGGRIGIKQPVDMLERAGAALRGQPRRLVQHDCRTVAVDHHRIGHVQLRLGQLALGLRTLVRGGAARRHAHHLPGGNVVGRTDTLAVHPDLPGARPARHGGKAD